MIIFYLFKIFNLHTTTILNQKMVTLSRNGIKRKKKKKRRIINFDLSNPLEARFERSSKSGKDKY